MTDTLHVERITMRPDWGEPVRIALGYRIGGILILSGHTSVDPQTFEVVGVGDFDAQVEQLFTNLESTLRLGGSSLANVIKVTIYLTDMKYYPKVVEFRGRYFTPPYPADTIIEVKSLARKDFMIEIEAVAIADEARA